MGENVPAYTMWMNGEAPVGGMMPLPAAEVEGGTPAHWLAYVGTPDCDATHAQALALGATSLVAPRDIPSVGRYAVLADPQGATFALYTPESAPTTPWAPSTGDISWHDLQTIQLAPALAFYQELFGWEPTAAMDMGGGRTYQMYGQQGVSYGGMFEIEAGMPASWLLYLRVADIDVALESVRAGGGEIVRGVQDVESGKIAYGRDPQGGSFAMHALNVQG
jgi:hypothetical protein